MPIKNSLKPEIDKLLREADLDKKIYRNLVRMEGICESLIEGHKVVIASIIPNQRKEQRKYIAFAILFRRKIAELLTLDRKDLWLTNRVLTLERRQDPDKFITHLMREEIISSKFALDEEEKIYVALNKCWRYFKSKRASLKDLKVVLHFARRLIEYVLNLVGYTRNIVGKKLNIVEKAISPFGGRRKVA